MTFASVTFLLLLATSLGLYWALPWQRARLVVLFLASLVFYAWRHWPSVYLLLGTIGLNYVLGRLIEARRHRIWLALGIAANLGVLAYFKYAAFLAVNLKAALASVGLEVSLPTPSSWQPLGISFFTFQVMAYLVDVWRGELRAERSLLVFATFKSFYGQLVAGPIVKGRALFPQLHTRRHFDARRFHHGLFLVLGGLFLKLAVADALRPFVDNVWAAPEGASTLEAWLAVYGYAVQLFADFWGYSTVAVGLGLLFGIELPVNFELPYLATSLQDFWRRWHVTLSKWFRDYLYIPLGGNRRWEWRNRIVTMTLAGLWHGAAWTFVLWGFLHGVWLAAEQALKRRLPGRLPTRWGTALRVVLVFHGVALLWIPFRAPSMQAMVALLSRLVAPPYFVRGALPAQLPVWILVFLLAHPWLDRLMRGGHFVQLRPAAQVGLAAALLWLIAAYAGPPADFIYYVF